jgi:hypothetical protein
LYGTLYWAYGVPISFYSDQDTHFKVTRSSKENQENEYNNESITQIQRALSECSSEIIFAKSPQAKRRIERSFSTTQDHLVSLF